jgi:hypothetical protein
MHPLVLRNDISAWPNDISDWLDRRTTGKFIGGQSPGNDGGGRSGGLRQ